MLEIWNIAQMRIQASHHGNNIFCGFVSLIPVLDYSGLVDEFLQMASVFRNNQMRSLGIVLQMMNDVVRVFFYVHKIVVKL